MTRRKLLLCFDAFGTLFRPKSPVPEQYAAVARQCGLDGFTTKDVQASFKTAFSSESKAHPNYGKAIGMGAAQWWTNVIIKTFQPLAGNGIELPKDLAPKLLHRFASDEGYALSPGITPLLRSLKHPSSSTPQAHISPIIGVITNSDDRVPSILSSLGLHVRPFRFGIDTNTNPGPTPLPSQQPPQPHSYDYDIDLHAMSYDVGFAKPDRRIFDAAEGMANDLVSATATVAAAVSPESGPASEVGAVLPWLKVYVGDEYTKDVTGALGAGWNAVLVDDRGTNASEKSEGDGLERLGDEPLEKVFPSGGPPRAVRARSVQGVLKWLGEEVRRGDAFSSGL